MSIASDPMTGIPAAEVEDVELYHPHSWITKYVFSQDAKVIGIQYSLTATAIGLVALVLSWLMRLQLGFPGVFDFITAGGLLPVHHHARHDHGGVSAHRHCSSAASVTT
jgi:cytochrome c oxidase subunit 1